MENFLLLASDLTLTQFTFWIGFAAMLGATLFFFSVMNMVDDKWKTSMLVAGLITGIAALHYYYMRDAAGAGDEGVLTAYRYVDWILTVPLMCVEFYLILAKAGATKKLMWNLILASTVMLVAGYIGQAGDAPGENTAQIWGTISGLAYFWVAYTVWLGDAKALAVKAGGKVLEAHNALCWFVLVGWAIYPIGYMAGTSGWYSDIFSALDGQMEVIYNVGDAVNKIGFGLVVYNLAVSK
tara:strand:- start:195 stop:911 length:717 start_codon:yes stop_codon:yes gene_type:complete